MPAFQVFLSSIFRGMESERDALARIVMPRIRKECEARGVDFAYIDLRWGIDDDLILQGGVVGHCLDHIDTTTPVFLGMIGPRYGSILQHLDHADLSATHHEFRRAYQNERELIFMICDTEACRAARVRDPRLAQMFEETPAECRDSYSSIEELIATSERRLIEALDRSYPMCSEADPLRDAAARQERHAAIIRGRTSPLWQGDAAQAWLGYLDQVTRHATDDTQTSCGIFPVIVPTAGDAEIVAVELTEFYRRFGPTPDLVFSHARGAEPDRSGAWIQRRLLSFLVTEAGSWTGPTETPSEAQVQVLLTSALAELAQQGQHLRVVLSRTDPAELLRHMRPLLISPACTVVTVVTGNEVQTLPTTIPGLHPPARDAAISRSLLQTVAARAGKALAFKPGLVARLASSPLCDTLTGTMLLGDWLVAWGDLNPDTGTSQDAWVQAEVDRVARITDLSTLAAEVLSGVSRVMAPIAPGFETLSKALLDALRVAPVPLVLDELTAIAEDIVSSRGLSADFRQTPMVMTYLAKAFTSLGVDSHAYRLTEPALWPEPADARAISSTIVRVLTSRGPDRRRAEGAARAAFATGQEDDRRRVLNTPGFPALIEVSLMADIAAEIESAAKEKLSALDTCYDPAVERLLADDALALIAALSGHDSDGCLDLAGAAQHYLKHGQVSAHTSTLAARAQTALDRNFRKDSEEWRRFGSTSSDPFEALRSALVLYEPDPKAEPQEAQDVLHRLDMNVQRDLPPQLAILRLQADLRAATALDTLGETAARIALAMARRILEAKLKGEEAEDAVRRLCIFAVTLAIASEEATFANTGAAALSRIDEDGIEADSLFTLDTSVVAQTMDDMVRQVWEARQKAEASDELFLTIIDRLISTLATSDRRFEYHRLARAFRKGSLVDWIGQAWQARHPKGRRAPVGEVLVNALDDLRGMAWFA